MKVNYIYSPQSLEKCSLAFLLINKLHSKKLIKITFLCVLYTKHIVKNYKLLLDFPRLEKASIYFFNGKDQKKLVRNP